MAGRYGSGRGTRMGKGYLSGTTLQTNPSGVTIDNQGLFYASATYITPTELGKLDGIAGYPVANTAAAKLLSGGTVAWAGTTVQIATGLTTITSFSLTAEDTTHVYANTFRTLRVPTAGGVSVALVVPKSGGSVVLAQGGGTICWMAFGV